AARYGLSADALAAADVVRVHDTGRGGIVVVLRQRVGGVEVFRHDAKVLLDRSYRLVAISGNLHPAATVHARPFDFVIAEADALAAAFGDLYGVAATSADFRASASSRAPYDHFDLVPGAAARAAGVSFLGAARVKRVLYAMPDRLVPAYFVELDAGDARTRVGDAYAYVVAADDGRVLHRENLKHDDVFTYRVWADATGDKRPHDGPLADFTPHPTGTPDGSYPDAAPPSLVEMEGFNTNPDGHADPWLPAGAGQTRGNNVDAYTDDDKPDGFSPGDLRATTTAPGVFDRTFDLSADPRSSTDQRMAAVTELFYVTNWLHDYWYDSGFDEAAGNAQMDNFGRGGVDGDPLLAQAQDGAPKSRDNSNMSAFYDGKSPRMQMYVWDGRTHAEVDADPIGAAPAATADFGPKSFDLTGDVALVDDGTGTTTDACEPVTNDLTGKVALLDRGTCDFKQKAVNAEAAGAIGVLIADNVGGEPPPPLGNGTPMGVQVHVPVLAITRASGNALKTALGGGAVSATLTRHSEPDRDGTLDNSIVAHEWGHYLHLRQVACANYACAGMSEGFADFNALMMVVRAGDDPGRTYALAQYATEADPDDPGYFGIRRYPYSTDETKNPLHYGLISDGVPLPQGPPVSQELLGIPNSEPHNVGEIWAAMLFEAYAGLLARTKGASPAYDYDEAHRRMADYVEAGLQLAPTDPTILEQRDAILAAAKAADADDFAAMAQGFANRGAGSCAVSPRRDSTDLVGAVDSFDIEGNAALDELAVTDDVTSCDHDGYVDAGETGTMSVRVTNAGWYDLEGAKLEATASVASVSFPSGASVDVPKLAPGESKTLTLPIAVAEGTAGVVAVELGAHVVSGAKLCPNRVTEGVRMNVDEVPNGSASDDVEARGTTWATDGMPSAAHFTRVEVDHANHAWVGVDFGAPSDESLESPDLVVSKTDAFVMTFTHKHSFEHSMKINWDGGVLEVSTDGGKTWKDASKLAKKVPYGGKIGDPSGQAHNALRGRQGFVAQNAAWPNTEQATVDFGTSLAGKTVRVRFRVASDEAGSDFGWQVDDIAFTGIDNTPFTAIAANRCGGEGTGGSGGGSFKSAAEGSGCGCVTAGDGAHDAFAWLAPLGLAALAAARRRRRGRRA
ncbi:MAG TPA: M36 family metallopeptidase, partial [Minicystis sp.]|nr:M36 family metallopeptidase [Minicystis sp.]